MAPGRFADGAELILLLVRGQIVVGLLLLVHLAVGLMTPFILLDRVLFRSRVEPVEGPAGLVARAIADGEGPTNDYTAEIVRGVVRRYLAPLRDAGIDTLVLGCTHYPLLARAIAAELPGIALVDSAQAIAAEVRAQLGEGNGGPRAEHRFFVTDTPERFLAVAGRFLGRPVDAAEHVDV